MESKLEIAPKYPANGNLRMYNMFPFRRYTSGDIGLEDMCCYVHDVAEMGYNAIWINPLQATGTMKQPHPDGKRQVSGSLYAMADDQAFNPLIFPNSKTLPECELLLKSWTQAVRDNHMFPLFDLVLNHIGIHEGEDTPLKKKLEGAGFKHKLQLLLPEAHSRWPDIQGIDYYKPDTQKRGLNTEPRYLDDKKIDLIFKTLWEPLITRYIVEYGFMGVRVDALTHVPVPVQQRAYRLVQKLVRQTYGTDAIIVGEFMAANPDDYITSLAACGLTHCLNPFSFYWGHNKEGGYCNDSKESPFFKQITQLPRIVVSTPKDLNLLSNLSISTNDLDETNKLSKNTIYIFVRNGIWHFALNTEPTDICFSMAAIRPVADLQDESMVKILQNFVNNDLSIVKISRDDKKCLLKKFHDSAILQKIYTESFAKTVPGGLIGVIGNHDVGTLKAKCMLDIAYGLALNVADQEQKQQIEMIYKNFKNTIKGARNTINLEMELAESFGLPPLDCRQLYLDLPMRMREKIFIQSMMCTGGWYSIAGDETGVCHKPEVFAEFAMDDERVGEALNDLRTVDNDYNFEPFICGINNLLKTLPAASCGDKSSMHQVILEEGIPGKKSDELLVMVMRYCANTNEFHLIAHSNDSMSTWRLQRYVAAILAGNSLCKVTHISTQGVLHEAVWSNGKLMPQLEETFSELSDCEDIVITQNTDNAGGLQQFGFFEKTENIDADLKNACFHFK